MPAKYYRLDIAAFSCVLAAGESGFNPRYMIFQLYSSLYLMEQKYKKFEYINIKCVSKDAHEFKRQAESLLKWDIRTYQISAEFISSGLKCIYCEVVHAFKRNKICLSINEYIIIERNSLQFLYFCWITKTYTLSLLHTCYPKC